MNILEIIEKKRDGKSLSKEEINFFISGVMSDTFMKEQVGAFLMAVALKGFNSEEAYFYSLALANSGKRFDISSINKYSVDKHSTGGVSDACTLIVVPVLAALGCVVGKYSTNNVGASFGTLDRLNVFEGYTPCISPKRFVKILDEVGASIIGNNNDIIPAETKLYELRKLTGTIPSIPLIACSIMSKKIAMGAKYVVLDIKCGEGALLKDVLQAEKLAKLMVQIGKMAGIKTSAIMSSLDQPLGANIGPSLEVYEALKVLNNDPKFAKSDLLELCREMVAHVLLNCEIAKSRGMAYEMFDNVIKNGTALIKFKQLVKAHGGNTKKIDNPELLIPETNTILIKAEKNGYLYNIDTEILYKAVNVIGAKTNNKINPNVGIELLVREGQKVYVDQPIAKVYYEISDPKFASAVSTIRKCFEISNVKPASQNLIYKILV